MTLPSLFLITLPVRRVSGATCHATINRRKSHNPLSRNCIARLQCCQFYVYNVMTTPAYSPSCRMLIFEFELVWYQFDWNCIHRYVSKFKQKRKFLFIQILEFSLHFIILAGSVRLKVTYYVELHDMLFLYIFCKKITYPVRN